MDDHIRLGAPNLGGESHLVQRIDDDGGVTPAVFSSGALVTDRVSAMTSCLFSSSRGSRNLPIAPVPPVTRTFILTFVGLDGMRRGSPLDALRRINPNLTAADIQRHVQTSCSAHRHSDDHTRSTRSTTRAKRGSSRR